MQNAQLVAIESCTWYEGHAHADYARHALESKANEEAHEQENDVGKDAVDDWDPAPKRVRHRLCVHAHSDSCSLAPLASSGTQFNNYFGML